MAIQAMHTAATGLRALSDEVDIIANNLANVNTLAFKRSRANFEDLLYQEQQLVGAQNSEGLVKPVGLQVGLGTKISNTQLLFSQGSALKTDQATDLSINGEGFFKVKIADGISNGIGYTRAGNFIVNANGDLVLANSDGNRLEPPINVPTNYSSLNITSEGRVFFTVPGDTVPQEATQLQLVRFTNPSGLQQIGGNIYTQTASSGQPVENTPGVDGMGTIQSGQLEGSNVDAVTELVGLIKTQRAFELNSQAITTSNEMLQTVTRLKQ